MNLPFAMAEPPLAGTSKDNSPPAAAISHESLRILCADDDEINRLVLHAFLAELAVAPVMADSGAEALTLAQDADFDVYLIDINMPGLGGVETLAALREIDARRGGPVPLAVAVTANVMQEDIKSYLQAGFDAHLPKPIVFEDLSAMLVRAQNRPLTLRHRPVQSRSSR